MSPRPVRIRGRVIACQRLDVSKRSDRRRWVLRVQLHVQRWCWLDDVERSEAEPVQAPCTDLWLVAPEPRWQRLFGRSPQVGEVLCCGSEYGGEAMAPMQTATMLG